jgi:hypothetical protein
LVLLLAQGAVVASVGVALATWIRRVGRAVAVSVASYAFVAFGWIVLLELDIPQKLLLEFGLLAPDDDLSSLLMCFSPLGAQALLLDAAATREARIVTYLAALLVLLATLAFALVVLAATLATFNRCMGRMSERPRRAPRTPVSPRVTRAQAVACG